MKEKVLLILVDGMRPDAMTGLPAVQKLQSESAWTMTAATVFPSVTLPCHMSLFHSVDPQRHGVTTNFYTPQVRPVSGLCEQLKAAKKRSAFFYDWEPLRDLARPDSLSCSFYLNGHENLNSRHTVAQSALSYVQSGAPDFVFFYIGLPDTVGHSSGWMKEPYLDAVRRSWDTVETVMAALPSDYTAIITADHGGHDQSHGTELPEDMTIPVLMHGPRFTPGQLARKVSIKDIAPTITDLLGAEKAPEWEGHSLLT